MRYGVVIDSAVEHGHLEMIQPLLNAYEDQEKQEKLGPTCHQAAGYAEQEGHFEIAQWLRGGGGLSAGRCHIQDVLHLIDVENLPGTRTGIEKH